MKRFILLIELLTLCALRTEGVEENRKTFDLANPIVFQAWAPRGWSGGHFGWSSALANIDKGPEGKTSWIFVGDPMGNVTRDLSYDQRYIKQTGVVWRCTLFRQGQGRTDLSTPECETLKVDPIRDCTSTTCIAGAPQVEYHSDNWVGGNIVSSQSRLVISAHHWHRGKASDPVVNGLAYWFDLQRMYTGTELNIGADRRHRLIPFYYPGNHLPQQFYSEPGSGGIQLPDLAHGEAGLSLHLTKEGQLLMGAPGVQTWRGAVVRYQDRTQEFLDSIRSNAGGRSEFNGFRIARPRYASTNDYFGYAVSSGVFFPGKFNQRETVSFVAGAPRAGNRRLSGQVVIFQLSPSGKELIDEQVVLEGDQFGSYFGSVLASVNVNGDRLDELLIGAPMYSEPTTSNPENFIDHGTVFLYSSIVTVTKVGGPDVTPVHTRRLIRITSGNNRGGRFGSAIVNLGDINEDGYEDFAIGAPYEEAEGDGGAVYIYYGKANLETEWTANLRIVSKTMSPDLRLQGFGCSFSTPLDIDHNYTPDLSIGSLTSQSVVILRTRPILDFETKVTYFGQNSRTPILQLTPSVKAFTIETCIKLKGKSLQATNTKLRLEVTLSMDTGQSIPRFSFVDDASGNEAKFELEVDANAFLCKSFTARADIAVDRKSASIEPISFEEWIRYKGKSSPQNTPLQYAIQSTQGTVNVIGGRGNDAFEPLAPFPLSKKVVLEDLNINSGCRNPSHCVPQFRIDAWWADDTIPGKSQQISEVELNWQKMLGIHVKLWNDGEPSYGTEVSFVFKGSGSTVPPRLAGIDLSLSTANCQSGLEQTIYSTFIVVCTLKKTLVSEESVELVLPVSLRDIYAMDEKDQILLGVSVQARNDTNPKRSPDLALTLVANARVDLIGSVTLPTDPKPVHLPFDQQYEVILTGTSPVHNLYFRFMFPNHGDKTSWLQIKAPKGIQCIGSFAEFKKEKEPDIKSPISPEGKPSASRRRRDTQIQSNFKSRLPLVERLNATENTTLLGCGTWKNVLPENCMDITCSLYKVHPNVPIDLIRFDMELNGTVARRILGETRYLLLESLGSVKIFKENKDQYNGKSFAQTIIQINGASISEKASILFYILSGIGGLLILILVMFALYKLGFFKRAIKTELEERKAEVAEQEATRRASMLENSNQEQQQIN